MIDPISIKLLATIAAAVFLRDAIRDRSRSTQQDVQAASSQAELIQRDLAQQVSGLKRRQALDLLHTTKRQYVSKSQEYWKLRQEFKEKLDILYSDIRLVNSMKAELFTSRQHHEIPALKAKTNELYAIVKDVDIAFKQYAWRVAEYNEIVAKIKSVIASHSDA